MSGAKEQLTWQPLRAQCSKEKRHLRIKRKGPTCWVFCASNALMKETVLWEQRGISGLDYLEGKCCPRPTDVGHIHASLNQSSVAQ